MTFMPIEISYVGPWPLNLIPYFFGYSFTDTGTLADGDPSRTDTRRIGFV